MTTTVFSSVADGRIQSQSGPGGLYETARAGQSLSVNITSAGASIGQLFQSGNAEHFIAEGFLDFNTSSIPDADTIDSVVLSLWCSVAGEAVPIVTEARLHPWGPIVTSADWVPGDTLASLPLLASKASTGDLSTTEYTDFASEAAFAAAIDKTGITYILLSVDRHRLGTAPAGAERPTWKLADAAGTDNDPKLVINHSAGGGPPPATPGPPASAAII